MGANRYVHIMFAAGGLILAYLLVQTGDWIWGLLSRDKAPDLILNAAAVAVAGAAAYVLWRNERVFSLATEVTNELRKVTWPTRKETSAATLVVIATVMIAALILSLFDGFWSWLTGIVYQ